jgi:heavy metal efflux system protein
VRAEVEKLNSDGTLPAGVKVIPFYDRSSLISVTTHTVLHNLVFGCLLVFFIQWLFLGDLRSAIVAFLVATLLAKWSRPGLMPPR